MMACWMLSIFFFSLVCFHLFQGYFFSEPRVISGNDLTFHFHSYYQLLSELNNDQPNIKRVTEYIERDVSLSYQILRFLSPSIMMACWMLSIFFFSLVCDPFKKRRI